MVVQQAAHGMLMTAGEQPQQYGAAYFWLIVAVGRNRRAGERDAIKRELDEVGTKLAPEIRAEIPKYAEEWMAPKAVTGTTYHDGLSQFQEPAGTGRIPQPSLLGLLQHRDATDASRGRRGLLNEVPREDKT
jgi:hypothetical protein